MKDNLALDKKILAYALGSKRSALELSSNISAEYFHISCQWLYMAIIKHFCNPKHKEIPTGNIIKEYLDKNYTDSSFKKDAIQFYKDVCQQKILDQEFTWHLEKLKLRYNNKIQRKVTSDVIKVMRKDDAEDEKTIKINDLMKDAVMAIDSIHKREAYKEGTLDESADQRAEKYTAVEEDPTMAQGILTGFSELDRMCNGLHPGELMLIAGNTGTGKSIVMHNIAVNAYLGGLDPLSPPPQENDLLTGANVLYFSLEMPKESQERRLDATMACVIANEIRDGQLNVADKEKYFKVLDFQKKYAKKFHIVDMPRGVTAREIELKYVEVTEKYGVKFDLIVVDYLALMSSNTPSKGQDWLELGAVAEQLHELGRTYSVPIITASQLNRSKDPNKQEHSTNRIARSAMVPDNVNIALQLGYRGEDEHTRFDLPVYVIKARDSEKGSFTLIKDFARMKVKDLTDEDFDDEF